MIFPVGIIAMLIAVIGIFYYIRVVRLLYFDAAKDIEQSQVNVVISSKNLVLVALPVMFILVNGVTPSALLNTVDKMIIKKTVATQPSHTKKRVAQSDIEDIFKFPH